jgi:hypothetical protein
LATSLASPIASEQLRQEEYGRELGFAAALVTGLTIFAVLVNGYHPYAEDGGVYLPEIKRLLDPSLYPRGSEFVMGHLRYSLFAPVMAGLVRETHASLGAVLLAVHLASYWMTLFAAWLLAARCYKSRVGRGGAVTLLAVWMTLPIAGTSLMLMDPYVTARSLSTPCALLAVVGAMEFLWPLFGTEYGERRWRGLVVCCAALAGACAMHPLMGAYALGSVTVTGVLLAESRAVRVWGAAGLTLTAVAMAGGVQLAAAPESGAYQRIMLTRDYWFLSEWHWYELIGLAAPLVILAVVGWGWRAEGDGVRRGLARTAIVVAVLFARTGMAVHAVARMQPLRVFQLVYVVMTLVVGAELAERVLQRRPLRWVAVFALLAGVMVTAERRTFPASRHLELPGMTEVGGNAWERAFIWISRSTPKDALLALDAQYITAPGEDAQGFRAIAERSALPDYSKDGGLVTNRPDLADAWAAGQVAQAGLNVEEDARRVARLEPLGVSWVVLERGAVTAFVCEYANEAVKVCRLP